MLPPLPSPPRMHHECNEPYDQQEKAARAHQGCEQEGARPRTQSCTRAPPPASVRNRPTRPRGPVARANAPPNAPLIERAATESAVYETPLSAAETRSATRRPPRPPRSINNQSSDRSSTQPSNQSSFFESSFFSSLKFSNACTSPRTPAVSMDAPMQAGTRYRRAGCAASKKCMTPTVTARPAV